MIIQKAYAFFIIIITMVAPAKTYANAQCYMARPVQLSITPKTNDIQYDYSQSLTKLQSKVTNTIDPYGIHSGSITQGFMEGQIKLERSANIESALTPYGVCMWFKSIDITLEIDPEIVIAKEIRADECMHGAVLNHEIKHINVDRLIVNKAAETMAQKIYKHLKTNNFVTGPVLPHQAKDVAQNMYDTIEAITAIVYEDMIKERETRQQSVDTRAEYDRVSAQCPSFHKRQRALYQKARAAKAAKAAQK